MRDARPDALHAGAHTHNTQKNGHITTRPQRPQKTSAEAGRSVRLSAPAWLMWFESSANGLVKAAALNRLFAPTVEIYLSLYPPVRQCPGFPRFARARTRV